MRALACRSLLLPLLVLWSGTPAAGDQRLERCRAWVRTEGPSERAAECFYIGTRDQSDLAGAAREALDELRALHPDAPWPHYYRGRVPNWLESDPIHLETAAHLFEERGEISAAVRARHYLVTWHMLWYFFEGRESDQEAARDQLRRLEALAERSETPQDRALVDVAQAHYLMLRAEDLEGAYLLLRRAHSTLAANREVHPHEMKECLRSLFETALRLGMADETYYWAEQNLRLAIEEGRLRDRAGAGFNAIVHRLLNELPRAERRRELLDDLYAVLEAARQSGYTWVEAASLHAIAELEGGPSARANLERCAELAGGDNELRGRCLKALATVALERDPVEARALLDLANRSEGQGPWAYLDAWEDRMRVLWATEPIDRALADSQAILALIETLRRNQVGTASDRLLSAAADAYHWLSGRLLLAAVEGEGDPVSSVGSAFAVIERLRAQALREALEAPASATQPPSPELAEALRDVDRQYVEITRRLFAFDLDAYTRAELLASLERLDRDAAEIRRQMDALNPAVPLLEPPGAGLLERVRGALKPDEALLSYQLGLWEGWDGRFLGGSWLLATTGQGTRTYRLEADRADLEPAVKALRARNEPNDAEALASLYERLMAPALLELPAGIRKLILIPDGLLHLLPFSLLHATGEPPLVERFEIQIVPSATVWLHWKEGTPLPIRPGAGALVLANPLLSTGLEASRGRAGSLASVAALGPLPYAEREGRRVLSRLDGLGRLERGDDASESLLKSADLSPYRILHFAAHAYLDLKRPELSGVVLAAGSDREDGLLRPSEIARLDGLDGKLVVLAACNTAAGEVLRGEGVLSLARAFFEAGAESVVASLWRLDDRRATEFFDDFYRHLGEGISVGQALARTQSAWSRRGKPASTWAGLVVLGNGDFVPLPGGVPKPRGGRWLGVGGLVALLIFAAFLLLRRPSGRLG